MQGPSRSTLFVTAIARELLLAYTYNDVCRGWRHIQTVKLVSFVGDHGGMSRSLPRRGDSRISVNAVRIHRVSTRHRELNGISICPLEHDSCQGIAPVKLQHGDQAHGTDPNNGSICVQAVGAV